MVSLSSKSSSTLMALLLLWWMLNARITYGTLGLRDGANKSHHLEWEKHQTATAKWVGRNLSSNFMDLVKTFEYEEESSMDFGKCIVSEMPQGINGSSHSSSEQMRSTHAKCNGVVNLAISIGQIPQHLMSKITSISISSSYLNILNLTEFHTFPALWDLTVTKSNVTFVIGITPFFLRNLNLSHNNLKTFDASLFQNWMSTKKHSLVKIPPTQYEVKTISNLLDSEQTTFTTSDYMSLKSSTKPHNYNSDNDSGDDTWSWTPFPEGRVTSSFGESDVNLSGVENNNPNIDGDGGISASSSSKQDIIDSRTFSRLEVIDISHNNITDFPKSIFYLGRLKSLRLVGNQLKCEFVWEKLWDWTKKLKLNSVLTDANEAFCRFDESQGARFLHYTVSVVLQARKDLEETCSTVNTSLCPKCSLYAFQRDDNPITHLQSDSENANKNQTGYAKSVSAQNGNGVARITISLKLDCSSKNLTDLPSVPPQTWQINVSNNFIKDLSPLKLPMYSNLIILDGKNNQVNLETIIGAPFVDKYNYLTCDVQFYIPTDMLTSLKTIRGQGVTFFGGNYIDCDCNYLKEIKPLLIENSKRIKDMKDLFCKDVSLKDGSKHTRVTDLQYSDVCHMDFLSDSEAASELYLYLIIFVEAVLIIVIIAKVWHDQRTFRRTGVLPWCSAKMPRLPCDAMLESLKEPPNINRHSGSATSSNTNVHHVQSVSHIQLQGILTPGGGSGSINANSERGSRSLHARLSNCPSTSSRTSCV